MRYLFVALLFVYALHANETKDQNMTILPNSNVNSELDLENYKELEVRESKIKFDESASNKAGIYNYKYSPNAKNTESKVNNIFLYGDFEKVYRFEALFFKDNLTLTSDSDDTWKKIVTTLHKYIDNEEREIVVSVVAFTKKVQNKNLQVSTGSAYTNFFQSIAQRDDMDAKTSEDKSQENIKFISKLLLDENLSQGSIYTETRPGKDNLYTEEFSDARELNNRVNVAIYVKEVIDPDTDQDGVRDSRDYCPATPIGAHVDKNGCPFIMTLDLKFAFDGAIIVDVDTYKNIEKISKFMTKYPVYQANIIGHTDSKGPDRYNQKLSLERAKLVKTFLVADGIDSKRISFEGRGESEPVASNDTEEGMHLNRRTEVELTLPHVEKKIKIRKRSRGRGE